MSCLLIPAGTSIPATADAYLGERQTLPHLSIEFFEDVEIDKVFGIFNPRNLWSRCIDRVVIRVSRSKFCDYSFCSPGNRKISAGPVIAIDQCLLDELKCQPNAEHVNLHLLPLIEGSAGPLQTYMNIIPDVEF